MAGKQARLVESALREFRPVQRNGDDQHLRWSVRRQPVDRLRQHLSKPLGGRHKAFIFQRVYSIAHASFIGPVGHGALKRRRSQPAGPACGEDGVSKRQNIAATRTYRLVLDGEFSPAYFANWRGRNKRQRGAAKGTKGGKQSTTRCIHGTSEDARHGAPCGSPLRGNCPLGGTIERQCVWVTAEDAPLSKGRGH